MRTKTFWLRMYALQLLISAGYMAFPSGTPSPIAATVAATLAILMFLRPEIAGVRKEPLTVTTQVDIQVTEADVRRMITEQVVKANRSGGAL